MFRPELGRGRAKPLSGKGFGQTIIIKAWCGFPGMLLLKLATDKEFLYILKPGSRPGAELSCSLALPW
ncbi:MAG: hypothetical protein ACP5QG_08875, partial [candidate division WOR-3 bacterium]